MNRTILCYIGLEGYMRALVDKYHTWDFKSLASTIPPLRHHTHLFLEIFNDKTKMCHVFQSIVLSGVDYSAKLEVAVTNNCCELYQIVVTGCCTIVPLVRTM